MHHSFKTGALVALLGCTLATPSFAAGPASQPKGALFSYDYAQLAYVDLDDGLDGFKLDGSFSLNPELALIASYLSADGYRNLDYDLFTLGLAYHARLVDVPRSDIVLHGEFARASLDHYHNNHFHSDDENGLRFGAMLRYRAQQNIELFGDLSYTSLYDNDLALSGGINLALNQQFSAVASIELSDNDMMLLGIRMQLR